MTEALLMSDTIVTIDFAVELREIAHAHLESLEDVKFVDSVLEECERLEADPDPSTNAGAICKNKRTGHYLILVKKHISKDDYNGIFRLMDKNGIPLEDQRLLNSDQNFARHLVLNECAHGDTPDRS